MRLIENHFDLSSGEQRRRAAAEIDGVDVIGMIDFPPARDLLYHGLHIALRQIAFVHAGGEIAVELQTEHSKSNAIKVSKETNC